MAPPIKVPSKNPIYMKAVKIFFFLLTFLLILPGLAGFAVMSLWNAILVPACGFAALTFLQSLGIFFLGQILSAGILFALFLFGGGIHAIMHHSHHSDWGHHWHRMTDEQRREFIARRRAHFGFHNEHQTQDNVSE